MNTVYRSTGLYITEDFLQRVRSMYLRVEDSAKWEYTFLCRRISLQWIEVRSMYSFLGFLERMVDLNSWRKKTDEIIARKTSGFSLTITFVRTFCIVTFVEQTRREKDIRSTFINIYSMISKRNLRRESFVHLPVHITWLSLSMDLV